jgi:flagellar hook protein FlgE
VDGITSDFYTRNGQFCLDNAGNLVNNSGLNVLGRAAQVDGTLSASVTPLTVSTGGIPAQPTSVAQISANLDASADNAPTPWDPQSPGTRSNFGSSIEIYDSLGNSHALEVYFCKTSGGQWDYHVLVSGDEVDPNARGQNVEVGSGSLSFATNGALDLTTTAQAVSVNFSGAAPGQSIAIGFGSQLSVGGTGVDGLTQFSVPSSVSAQSQDGHASGAFSGISIEPDGTVRGMYTNGESTSIGQLVVAKFRSNNGLAAAGESLMAETRESGSAALGAPGSGGRGTLTSGALESSNVDLGQDMVDMISHQRGYGANARVIATADEMLASLMTLRK